MSQLNGFFSSSRLANHLYLRVFLEQSARTIEERDVILY